jgi:hypothetical protein
MMIGEPSNFILFKSYLLDHLNHRQAILMGLLNGMSNKKGYAYLKNSTICDLLKASESTIKTDLRLLEELKFIRRELIRNDKQEVIERRIYPMDKINTEVGVEYAHRVGQNLTIGGDEFSPIYKHSDNNTDKNNNKEDLFEELWTLYTKQGNRKTSLSAFNNLNKSEIEIVKQHLPIYIKNHIDNDKMKFLPHFSTYLNQKRFNDNLPYKEIKQIEVKQPNFLKLND